MISTKFSLLIIFALILISSLIGLAFTFTKMNKINEHIVPDIENFIKNKLQGEFIYYPNPGNAGDNLIGYATVQIFKRLNLKYTFTNKIQKFTNKVLVYGGGGNLVPMYNECRKFLMLNHNHNDILILPHTIYGNEDLLKKLGKRTTIMCREMRSYNHVMKHFRYKNNVYVADDLALSIDLSKLNIYPIKGNNVLNSFRIDGESKDKSSKKITDNIDLSLKLMKGTHTKDLLKTVSTDFLEYINKFEIVNTDRLHVSIAACLLGKHVNLYANSYYKNRSIYEYSLKKKFPKCKFYENYNP